MLLSSLHQVPLQVKQTIKIAHYSASILYLINILLKIMKHKNTAELKRKWESYNLI